MERSLEIGEPGKKYMPTVTLISEDYAVKPEISFNGHTMVICGKKAFYVIDPV